MSRPPADAPLFQSFWDNGVLNASRDRLLQERIARDSAQPYRPPRPLHPQGAVPLPPADAPQAGWLDGRRSVRAFAGMALELQQVANLLCAFAGRADGSRLLPSGGGKYPMLVYGVFDRVADAPEWEGQRFWYDPHRQALCPLGAAPAWPALRGILGVDWAAAPPLTLFLVARAEGMLAKYGERGGRFMLLEAGSYMGLLTLELARAGLDGVPLGSFHDDDALRLFELDDRHLAVLAYACGVGA